MKTEQENLWTGAFGDDYVDRNRGEAMCDANEALFARILKNTDGVKSVLELGANIGMNLIALKRLLPDASFSGVEINAKAAAGLRSLGYVTVHESSLLDFTPKDVYDFVLFKGVLIHLAPDKLTQAYDAAYASCGRWLCVAEYYNPTPAEVPYRGKTQALFKRDFAGEILDRYSDLKLVDYGFVYHRDPKHPLDDITWFLLEKTRGEHA